MKRVKGQFWDFLICAPSTSTLDTNWINKSATNIAKLKKVVGSWDLRKSFAEDCRLKSVACL
jgi:hypothetical protein